MESVRIFSRATVYSRRFSFYYPRLLNYSYISDEIFEER